MTNLEYYKDQFIEMIGSEDVDFCCYFNELHDLGCDSCPCCEKYSPNCNTSKFYDWLLEEHKEPIKLMSWEKDLLDTLVYGDNNYRQSRLYNVVCLEGMKRRYGHFRGVTDISMTIGEILENCEVIDDD